MPLDGRDKTPCWAHHIGTPGTATGVGSNSPSPSAAKNVNAACLQVILLNDAQVWFRGDGPNVVVRVCGRNTLGRIPVEAPLTEPQPLMYAVLPQCSIQPQAGIAIQQAIYVELELAVDGSKPAKEVLSGSGLAGCNLSVKWRRQHWPGKLTAGTYLQRNTASCHPNRPPLPQCVPGVPGELAGNSLSLQQGGLGGCGAKHHADRLAQAGSHTPVDDLSSHEVGNLQRHRTCPLEASVLSRQCKPRQSAGAQPAVGRTMQEA